jgi:hypothetical protein
MVLRHTGKQAKFQATNEVRAIGRERVGTVKPGQTIVPKSARRPKHKKSVLESGMEGQADGSDGQ